VVQIQEVPYLGAQQKLQQLCPVSLQVAYSVDQESGPQLEALFSVVVLFSQIPNLLLKEVYSVANNKVLYSTLALLYFPVIMLSSKR
jgi:hypothetical protein